MTDQSAPEVLNDLIQVNSERISRYEHLITGLDPGDKELRQLFARIIGQSYQYKIILATELQDMGETINLSPMKRGIVYKTAFDMIHKPGTGNRMQILNQSHECEDAVLKAYGIALRAEDVAAYLRDLLSEHQASIIQSENEIRMFKDQIV